MLFRVVKLDGIAKKISVQKAAPRVRPSAEEGKATVGTYH